MPYTKTLEQWRELNAKAKTGNPEAQWELGDALADEEVRDPSGVVLSRPDPRVAFHWFLRSAKGGHPYGQNRVGICLSSGSGCRRNQAEALRWFKRAVRQKDRCAIQNIGLVYRDLGNHRRAAYWFQRAVEQGDHDQLVDLGHAFYRGDGVRRDPKKAVQYFRDAMASNMFKITEGGREEAMIGLAIAFHEGTGVKKSNAQALKLLTRANEDDDHKDARLLIRKIKAESMNTVDDYLNLQQPSVQAILHRVRTIIRKAIPKAEEGISYKMPVYKVDGEPVIYFAAWKKHYSLYPASGRLLAAFKDEIAPYEVNKSTIRFSYSEPVPAKLIERIAKFRAKEVVER